jgi:hypothetical protein
MVAHEVCILGEVDDLKVLHNDTLVLTQGHTKAYTKSTQQNAHQTLQERHTIPYNNDTPNP